MQWYRIGVNKIPPTIDTVFATCLQVVRSHCATYLESIRWQKDHGKTRGLSCNDILLCLDVLSDVDSEHEADIEDSLSWDESDPDSEEVSDSYSEISASESDSEEKQDVDSGEILGKDGYVWSQKRKSVRITPMRNIVKEKPRPKGNGSQADTPLKSFELFFDDVVIRGCDMD